MQEATANQATDSQIAMFRGAIALAWADGVMIDSEKARLESFFENNLSLSPSQKTLLIGDIAHPIALEDVWAMITDPLDRAHLIDIAPVILRADDDYAEIEQRSYADIYARHMASLDQNAIERDVVDLANRLRLQREAQEESRRHEGTRLARILRFIGGYLV